MTVRKRKRKRSSMRERLSKARTPRRSHGSTKAEPKTNLLDSRIQGREAAEQSKDAVSRQERSRL